MLDDDTKTFNLDSNNLDLLHVDHIVPQSLVKDNSWDNKVLTTKTNNDDKGAGLVPKNIRQKQSDIWKKQLGQGIISKKKYANLTRSSFSEGDK